MKIITLDTDPGKCLIRKAEAIPNTPQGWAEAKEIVQKLEDTLRLRMPAAGLSSPQINISRQIFIFSWNRTSAPEAVINPFFEPLAEEKAAGWEGCFSVPLALAHVPRYQSILATYTNRDGNRVQYHLKGFAARVFQHESDHLEGIENIHRQDAAVRQFKTQDELMTYLQEIKKGDQSHYIQPEKIEEQPEK